MVASVVWRMYGVVRSKERKVRDRKGGYRRVRQLDSLGHITLGCADKIGRRSQSDPRVKTTRCDIKSPSKTGTTLAAYFAMIAIPITQ